MNNWCICWYFHAYVNGMHGSRSKIPSKKCRSYIYDVKFLALLGALYIYILDVDYVSLGVASWLHRAKHNPYPPETQTKQE
jgi:hypothetical protein